MNSQFYLTGFGSLSSFVASDDDQTLAIFKRFDKLAYRDILYYQSELAELQALQDHYDCEDARDAVRSDAWNKISDNARDWSSWTKAARATEANDRSKLRKNLAMRIRKLLKEYRKDLLLQSTLVSLPSPSKQSLEAMSLSLHQPNYDVLTGASSLLYPQSAASSRPEDLDYASLLQRSSPDPLTSFLKNHCSWLFSSKRTVVKSESITHAPSPHIRHYSHAAVSTAAYFISTLLAAALLFIPIYCLYHVANSSPATTMGLIAMFTVLFAAAIAPVTSAKRGEIFGATAAYAAVLVVFVSGDFAGKAP